jgi:flagellar basal-body rod modification protein FlgD
MTTTSSVSPVSSTSSSTTASSSADSAYGLSFNSLLQIILTQLTYQDPLKPMDNFEFVSQLAQFTQVEQGQTMVTDLQDMLSAQTTSQAAALLGQTIDVTSGSSTLSGVVTAVALSSSGSPTVTIETSTGETVSSLAIANITQIRPGSATTGSTSSSSTGS